MTRNIEEGERCPECGGIAVFKIVNCSCHISPPCNACVNAMPECEKCGLTEVPSTEITNHENKTTLEEGF